MLPFIRSRWRAFGYAFDGWKYMLRTQANAWIHAAASVLVVCMSAWLGISRQDWALIIIAIAMVWMAEFLNTAVEVVVDLASPGQHELARIGKDVGAAAVLVSAGSAVLLGLLVLGPPLLQRLVTWLAR
jgi:diacylglycerol kinase